MRNTVIRKKLFFIFSSAKWFWSKEGENLCIIRRWKNAFSFCLRVLYKMTLEQKKTIILLRKNTYFKCKSGYFFLLEKIFFFFFKKSTKCVCLISLSLHICLCLTMSLHICLCCVVLCSLVFSYLIVLLSSLGLCRYVFLQMHFCNLSIHTSSRAVDLHFCP